MDYSNKNFWQNKKVFLTGHTGFKGSWLFYLLKKLSANVVGYSLAPNTKPSLFSNFENIKESYFGDIRNKSFLNEIIQSTKPEIVFHLAAQPLVISSYKNPIETYDTNIIGTINLLESLRNIKSIKAVIIITTDKVYKNNEWKYSYRENDKLGGYDPYSSSKACVEIITNSYMNSFFKDKNIFLSTARAGNVIGGGDWSNNRLIPDIVKSIFKKKNLTIRYPDATRPWQHVLEPLFGYLELGRKTYLKKINNGASFNFGPFANEEKTVRQIVKKFLELKNINNENINILNNNKFHEASALSLNIDKSVNILKWKPLLTTEEALNMTVNWYNNFYNGKKVSDLLNEDIKFYLSK